MVVYRSDKLISISIKSLTKHFNHHGTEVEALTGIDLQVTDGEMRQHIAIAQALVERL